MCQAKNKEEDSVPALIQGVVLNLNTPCFVFTQPVPF